MKKQILSILTLLVLTSAASMISACGQEAEPPEPIETVTVYGKFYTLNEAYDDGDGFMELETFRFINDNLKTPENYAPLDEGRREKIIHDYNQTHALKSEQLEIDNYGSYGDCTVLRIRDKYYENEFSDIRFSSYKLGKQPAWASLLLPAEFYTVRIWRESPEPEKVAKPQSPNGVFYSLEKAYEHGYVIKEDLQDLKEIPWKSLPKPEGWSELEEKIKRDFFLTGLEVNSVREVEFLGRFRECILVRIVSYIFDCPFGVDVVTFHEFDGISIKDTYPKGQVWVPLDK